jgi:hypothetical protein
VLGYALVDGFVRADSSEALVRLKQAAQDVGGTIVDFASFTHQAVRLSVELPAEALPRLRDALEADDVHLFEQTRSAIASMGSGSPRRLLLALVHLALLERDIELDEQAAPSSAAVSVPVPVPMPPG